MIGHIDFEDLNIYVSQEPVNMWKSFDALAVLVQESIGKLPSAGDMFIFYNKTRNKVKILFWDGNGFVIYYKRFERNKFKCLICLADNLFSFCFCSFIGIT